MLTIPPVVVAYVLAKLWKEFGPEIRFPSIFKNNGKREKPLYFTVLGPSGSGKTTLLASIAHTFKNEMRQSAFFLVMRMMNLQI